MMTREQFAATLPAYVHGELPASSRAAVAEFLQVHPDEAALATDLEALADGVRPSDPPAVPDLLPAVKAGVAQQLRRGSHGTARRVSEPSLSSRNRGPLLQAPWRRRRAPGRRAAALLVIAGCALVYVTAHVIGRHGAYADALSRLAAAPAVRIEGSVLAPGGTTVPLRVWLERPHPHREHVGRNRYRIEVGAPEEATVIVGQSGFRRLLTVPRERVYGLFKEYDAGPSAARLAEALRLPSQWSWAIPGAGVSRRDVGEEVRYTFTRQSARGPGRNVIDIARDERLLKRHALSMHDGEDWVPVSDLTYTVSGETLPDSLFSMQPPAGYRQVDLQEENRWWFERSLSYERAPLFASTLRTAAMAQDWEVVMDPAPCSPYTDPEWTEVPQLAGGIWRFEACERPLLEVLSSLGNGFEARAEDPELAGRRVSLRLHYRHGLTPERRLALAGNDLGVRAVLTDYVDSTQTNRTFAWDGSDLPALTGFGSEPFRRAVLDDGRVRYTASRISLRFLASNLWWQALDWRPGVSVYFEAPAGDDGPDPADQLVDADIVTDGTWKQNAAVLAERYGVTYADREVAFRTRFIEVSR